MALARGRVAEATRDAAELDALAARAADEPWRATAKATRGRVLVARGEAVAGAAALLAAAAAWDGPRAAALEVARATELAARALRAGGGPERQEEAEALAHEAQTLLATVGRRPGMSSAANGRPPPLRAILAPVWTPTACAA